MVGGVVGGPPRASPPKDGWIQSDRDDAAAATSSKVEDRMIGRPPVRANS